MIIQNYNLTMAAQSLDVKVERKTRIELNPSNNHVDIRIPVSEQNNTIAAATQSPIKDSNLATLKNLLEYIFGIKTDVAQDPTASDQTQTSTSQESSGVVPPSTVYESSTSLRLQTMSFQANADVYTSDGKHISLNLSENQTQLEFNHTEGLQQVKDPLTLDGGKTYIAFDSNGNNQIDGPEELLGFKSGDAFADLSKLDTSSNGWLDSNDAAWKHLYSWSESGGSSKLSTDGIGALFTGKVDVNYETSTALQRAKGVALMENGDARIMTRIDLKA